MRWLPIRSMTADVVEGYEDVELERHMNEENEDDENLDAPPLYGS